MPQSRLATFTESPMTVKSARRTDPIIPWITEPVAIPTPTARSSNSRALCRAEANDLEGSVTSAARGVGSREDGDNRITDELVDVSAVVLDDRRLLSPEAVQDVHDLLRRDAARCTR